jgi:hypothetical protein
MRAPPFHGDNAVTFFAKAMKAELRESHRSAREFFLHFRNALRSPFAQVRAMDLNPKSDARRHRAGSPRLAERGTSILLMAGPTGSPPSRSYGVTSLPASGGLQPITSHPPSVAAATYGVAG